MKTSIIAILLLASSFAFADDPAEAAFCASITEQAKAQRDLLRTPSAVVGPIQPNTGTPPQMVFGITNSLADDRKASLTMSVARKTCELYTSSTEAQQHLLYALPSIEKDVLRHRLLLIDQTSTQLDTLIAENMKLVEAGNLARPTVYTLQGAKIRLDTSRTAALTGIASPYVPPLSNVPLRDLIAAKMESEVSAEDARTKLAKQEGWDVKLSVGAHQQISSTTTPGSTSSGAYGEVGITYNLSRHQVNRHLDNSTEAYRQWKEAQFDDVSNQSRILKQQMVDTVAIQSQQLEVLRAHEGDITTNLKLLDGIDTSAAITFRNELIADLLILRVDIGDVEFRMGRLQAFLAGNF